MLSLREGKMPQIVRFVLQSCTFRFRDYMFPDVGECLEGYLAPDALARVVVRHLRVGERHFSARCEIILYHGYLAVFQVEFVPPFGGVVAESVIFHGSIV